MFLKLAYLPSKLRFSGKCHKNIKFLRGNYQPIVPRQKQSAPAGVPQGTKLGPWLFLLMINDLVTPSALFGMWKYVDDTTLSEKVPKGQQSRAQEAVDHVSNWSAENLFQLNLEKTKELTITFRRSPEHFDPVTVDGIQIQETTSSKLLGLIINNTLTWNDHVDSLI